MRAQNADVHLNIEAGRASSMTFCTGACPIARHDLSLLEE